MPGPSLMTATMPDGRASRRLGAKLGTTGTNDLVADRTGIDNAQRPLPRSRTDLNGSGRPRWYLRIRCRLLRPGLGYVEQRAQYVGDVHYADEASVSHDRQVPKVPARHDLGRVTDACRGADDGRTSGHQLINPDVARVLPVRDRMRDVSIGDDADRLAGLSLRDDQGRPSGALHQVGGCGHVVVLVNRRHRWMHDVRDYGRGRRRMLG